MKNDIFDIAFELDHKQYKGWVNPSEKQNTSGAPVSFHVVLNDVSFGYLAFRDCKWTVNEERPDDLVDIVGKQIEKHFQF